MQELLLDILLSHQDAEDECARVKQAVLVRLTTLWKGDEYRAPALTEAEQLFDHISDLIKTIRNTPAVIDESGDASH
jgi:hypothetical protein